MSQAPPPTLLNTLSLETTSDYTVKSYAYLRHQKIALPKPSQINFRGQQITISSENDEVSKFSHLQLPNFISRITFQRESDREDERAEIGMATRNWKLKFCKMSSVHTNIPQRNISFRTLVCEWDFPCQVKNRVGRNTRFQWEGERVAKIFHLILKTICCAVKVSSVSEMPEWKRFPTPVFRRTYEMAENN